MKPRSKPDDGLRALIAAHLPALRGSAVHWTPVESAATASGIPDLEGCWRGRSAWVECKATPGWALGTLSEFQVGWALRRLRAGGRAFVMTRRRHSGGPRLGPPVDELWVHGGEAAAALRAGGLRAAEPLLRSSGGPEAWPWEGVGLLLFGA